MSLEDHTSVISEIKVLRAYLWGGGGYLCAWAWVYLTQSTLINAKDRDQEETLRPLSLKRTVYPFFFHTSKDDNTFLWANG